MIQFKSPSDRKNLLDRFRKLTPDTAPAFGLMTAQHMVEHVCLTFSMSNGRMEIAQTTPERLANITKRRFTGVGHGLSEGFQSSYFA